MTKGGAGVVAAAIDAVCDATRTLPTREISSMSDDVSPCARTESPRSVPRFMRGSTPTETGTGAGEAAGPALVTAAGAGGAAGSRRAKVQTTMPNEATISAGMVRRSHQRRLRLWITLGGSKAPLEMLGCSSRWRSSLAVLGRCPGSFLRQSARSSLRAFGTS